MNCQGKDTNTVLTNLSNYLTVVSNEPYSKRKLQRYGLPALRSTPDVPRPGRRGLRPLHRTTLNLVAVGEECKYTSTMKDSYSGKHDLHHANLSQKCPSLHFSQFDVGTNSQHSMSTTNNELFRNHTGNPITTHVDRARWYNQMAGQDMINCTRYDGFSKMDFSTTYSQNHHELINSNSEPDQFNGRWRTSIYNICNGHLPVQNARRFTSVSGNQVLSETRMKISTNILC